MLVCDRCKRAIESREGKQESKPICTDKLCEWCEEAPAEFQLFDIDCENNDER